MLFCGTNTTALKKGISPSNNDWHRSATIEMHLKEVLDPRELNIKNEGSCNNAVQELQSLVMQDGEVIAKTLPYNLFKLVKKLQKEGELEQYLQEDGDLDMKKLKECVAE